jgi:hypothetical protein
VHEDQSIVVGGRECEDFFVGKIYVVSASSAISGVKPEHARLKPYENP